MSSSKMSSLHLVYKMVNTTTGERPMPLVQAIELEKCDQLKTDSTFLLMCKTWEEEGKCPLGLEIYLLDEWDMVKGAEACKWSRSVPDNIGRATAEDNTDKLGGTRPAPWNEGKYVWVCTIGNGNKGLRSSLPMCLDNISDIDNGSRQCIVHDTHPEAILWLIKRWIEVEPIVIWDNEIPKEVLSKDEAIEKWLKLKEVEQAKLRALDQLLTSGNSEGI